LALAARTQLAAVYPELEMALTEPIRHLAHSLLLLAAEAEHLIPLTPPALLVVLVAVARLTPVAARVLPVKETLVVLAQEQANSPVVVVVALERLAETLLAAKLVTVVWA
jgi:hypothetical protein